MLLKKRFLFILCYHGIGGSSTGLFKPAFVPEEYFRQHVSSMRGSLLPPENLAGYFSRTDRIHRDCYLITFDDGYAESCLTAARIMESAGAKAVFFVCSAPVFERSLSLIDFASHAFTGLSSSRAETVRTGDGELDRLLQRMLTSGPGNRASAIEKAFIRFQRLSGPSLSRAVEYLRGYIAVEDVRRRALTLDECKILQKQGHVIANHTHAHRMLGMCAQKECDADVGRCGEYLSQNGFTAGWLAYPYGTKIRIGETGRIAAERNNVQFAFTCERRAADPGDDHLMIPRIVVGGDAWEDLSDRCEIAAWRSILFFSLKKQRNHHG